MPGIPQLSLDIAAHRTLNGEADPRSFARLALAMPAALIIYLLFDDARLMGAVGATLVVLLLWDALVSRLPDRVEGPLAVALFGLGILRGVGLVFIVFACWTAHPAMGPVMASLSVLAMMVSTAAARASITFQTYIDIAAENAGLLILPFLFARDGNPTHEVVVLAVVCLTISAIFMVSMRNALNARRELQEHMDSEIERSRLRVLGQLTGGVAHDFNNLLTVIMGNLELHQMDPSDPDLLAEAQEAAIRAATLTSELLAYSRKTDFNPEVIDLSEPVKKAVTLARRLVPATVTLDADVSATGTDVFADGGKLEGVVLNLIINARDALPYGGSISVTLDEVPRNSSETPVQFRGRPSLRLCVKDTGTGIPPEFIDKIFDPYFTTKEVGKGSGLGLSMAKNVVEQSNGLLTVKSVVGEGTSICIWLPEMDSQQKVHPLERTVQDNATIAP